MNKWQMYLIIFAGISIAVIVFFFGRSTVTINTDIINASNVKPAFNIGFESDSSYNPERLQDETSTFWEKKVPDIIIKKDSIQDGVGEMTIKPVYIASVDTSYNDSSLITKVKFVSPIPIHPDSYFKFKFIQKSKKPLINDSWWKDRFILYMGVGLSSNGTSIPMPTIQIGFGIRLGSL